jgi:hypothetical protein
MVGGMSAVPEIEDGKNLLFLRTGAFGIAASFDFGADVLALGAFLELSIALIRNSRTGSIANGAESAGQEAFGFRFDSARINGSNRGRHGHQETSKN